MNRALTPAMSVPAVLMAATLAFSCSPAPLKSSGEVLLWSSREEPALAELGATLPGLRLVELPRSGGLAAALEGDAELFYLDWNTESSAAARDGRFADLSRWRRRLGSAKLIRPSLKAGYFGASGAGRDFLPSSLYAWGLLYDKEALESLGIPLPADLAGLEAAFEAIAGKGLTPLALGSSFGWPLLGLVSILDMRMNGVEAHAKLLQGQRSFDDPSLLKVYARLEEWRNRAWLSADAATMGWTEALQTLADGKAVFAFLPATAFSRVPRDERLAFAAFPPVAPGKARAELVAVRGFFLGAKAAAPEAALALADAYVAAGSPGVANDHYSLPAIVASGGKLPPSANKAAEEGILSGAEALLPQLDWMLAAQASYDARLAATAFLRPGKGMDAAAFARALASATSR